jgi:hypothetical protein
MPALPLLLLLAVTAPVAGDAAGPRTFAVADGSTLSYRLVHKFHAVDGISKAVEGKARWLPDGTVQVMVRARVDSFDSGNSNRDAQMKEVTEADRLPYVLLKAVAEGLRAERYPADVRVPLRGVLEFHGVAREVAVTATVHFAAPDRAEVSASFPVSLTAHGVERPSLLFVKVDDRIEIRARLSLALEKPR